MTKTGVTRLLELTGERFGDYSVMQASGRCLPEGYKIMNVMEVEKYGGKYRNVE